MALLHCIDHTFNNTITGSAKLQRAMFSDSDGLSSLVRLFRLPRYSFGPPSAVTAAKLQHIRDTPRCTPLEMLFQQLLLREDRFNIRLPIHNTTTSGIGVHTGRGADDSNPQTLLKRFAESKACNQESSWRKVEIHQTGLEDWEKFSYVDVTFRRHKGYEGKNWYCDTFPLEEGSNLGRVFEKYVEIMSRTLVQHAAHAMACTQKPRGG